MDLEQKFKKSHPASPEMIRSKTSSISNDFVSADVNEALQEAREIITKGRARDNPNERLIDDATTVKVTHQGSRNDPVEVTVRRSRIVSQPNTDEEDDEQEDCSLSDSNLLYRLHASTDKSRVLRRRKPKADSHDNLTYYDDKGNRHTNVRYRRKLDALWRRDDQVDAFSSDDKEDDDAAQLEVDLKEEMCTDEGSHLVIKTWEARWTVQSYDLLPEWLQDNEFLHTGHRPPLPSFAECFKSILSLHTETGNIWTHMIGCVAFFFLALWFLTRPDTHIQFQEKMIFSFFFVGAILCLGLSFLFHTLSCHSIGVVKIFSKLDYMGISLLIIGSFIPWIYYGFYCRREPKVTYIAMVTVLGFGAIVVSLWDKFSESRFRPIRAAVFVSMGLSGLVPTVHFVMTDGVKRLIDENSFYWLIAMSVLYLFGAMLYATRTPERFFPGKCDYWFQSHQLFHLCVVCAAFAHYYGISEMAMNRLNGDTCNQISIIESLHKEL